MCLSDLSKVCANTGFDSRVFLYEVVMQYQGQELSQCKGSLHSKGRVFLRVPYHRMQKEMQRISRLGGKIVSIRPLNSSPEFKPKINSDLPWWIEISTAKPYCIYYFGPFESFDEARFYQPGYIEDLEAEGAQGISIKIRQCRPQILTQDFNYEF